MKLLEQMRQKIKLQGLSPKTFGTYSKYCNEYFLFLRNHFGEWKHPKECGRDEIEAWLTRKANGKEWVSNRTQNLAGRIVEASPALRYNYTLLLQGLASWVSRFYFQMGKRTGQHCCARSLTSVRQPVRFTRLDWRSDH